MAKARNILFIMCDQLRGDYLSCTGHPRLETPHIDGLATKGVIFNKAYCQAPICGGSRMCFYTGRYAFTHGATWNGVPLPVGEKTMGDHLRPLGLRVGLVGKTHMVADREGMDRVGLDPATDDGLLISQCGFEPYERDDGLHGLAERAKDLAYNKYLWDLGYDGDNPWHDWANSAEGPDGEILSGWNMRNCHLPARIKEEHSETAYMTNRAMEFITETGDDPWCLHLSYIKPHWPYIAPAPYHNMYSGNDILPANRHPKEKEDGHPVLQAYATREDCITFSRDDVRQNVIPAYMGLIKQIDDHMGRLFAFLEEQGRMDDTMIVFTSDHGDYLGDHWLGEKELFHEESVRIPMIVYNPDESADATRGTTDDRLVESIDLLPTFVDALGGDVPRHVLEGRSLVPVMEGTDPEWRSYAISESEYATRVPIWDMGIEPVEARATMVRTQDWKYVHHEKYRPELFDLKNDPEELNDLGDDPAYEETRVQLREMMFESLRQRKTRVTIPDEPLVERARNVFNPPPNRPVHIGKW